MPLPRVGQVVTILPVAPATDKREGICKFVGETQFAEGLWVGIELIGSQGKNNGTVVGVQYFVCEPGKGVFIRPELIEERSADADRGADSHFDLELRVELEDLKGQLAEKDKILEEVTMKAESLELDAELANEQCLVYKDEIEVLQERLKHAGPSADSGEGGESSLEGTMTQAETVVALRHALESLQEEHASVLRQLEELKEQLTYDDKTAEMMENLTESKLELGEEVEQLRRKLQHVEGEYKELQGFSALQDEELTAQREELLFYEEKLASFAKENEAQFSLKNKEIDGLRAKLAAVEGECQELKETSSDRQQELMLELRSLKQKALDYEALSLWDNVTTNVLQEALNVYGPAVHSLSQMESLAPVVSKISSGLSAEYLSRGFGLSADALKSSPIETASWKREISVGLLLFRQQLLKCSSSSSSTNEKKSEEICQVKELSNVFVNVVQYGKEDASRDKWASLWSTIRSLFGGITHQVPVTLGESQCAVFEALQISIDTLQDFFSLILSIMKLYTVPCDELKECATELTRSAQLLPKIKEFVRGHAQTNLPFNSEKELVNLITELSPHMTTLRNFVSRCREREGDMSRGLVTEFADSSIHDLIRVLVTTPPSVPSMFVSGGSGMAARPLGQLVASLTSAFQRIWSELESSSSSEEVTKQQPSIMKELLLVLESWGSSGAGESRSPSATRDKNSHGGDVEQNQPSSHNDDEEQKARWSAIHDKLVYQLNSFKDRCTELEDVVETQQHDIDKRAEQHQKDLQNYKSAISTFTSDNARLAEELSYQKKLVQQSASTAPYSTKERKGLLAAVHFYKSSLVESAEYNGCQAAKRQLWTPTHFEKPCLKFRGIPGS